MDPREATRLIEPLRRTRALPVLRLLDDAGLDAGPAPEADPDAVEPYRWLLARVGDGVRLTQAGYLPPAIVLETVRSLGWEDRWIGKHNREDQTLPVLLLREYAQRYGLLRKQRGVLHRTVAGRRLTDDPAALWWHIAERLPLARTEAERIAGLLYLLAAAARSERPQARVADALRALGWVDAATGAAPVELDALELTRDTAWVFDQLGLVEGRRRAERRFRPGAVQLARAALLGPSRPHRPAAVPAGPPPAGRPDEAVELTVVLRDVEPPVWRRLLVPVSLPLAQLHTVLQTAMGWRDVHLHLFEVDGVRYGDVGDLPGPRGDETSSTVGDAAAVTSSVRYEYDFGDGWQHDVRIGERLASAGSGTPRCLAGGRACPPEDCGGPPGYAHLLAVLADPAHPERPEVLDRLGGEYDPEVFDAAATDELLALHHRQGGAG